MLKSLKSKIWVSKKNEDQLTDAVLNGNSKYKAVVCEGSESRLRMEDIDRSDKNIILDDDNKIFPFDTLALAMGL